MSSPLKITILGCHSATPKSNYYPTAQVVEVRGQLILIDCGEGTQVRLREQRVKFNQIKHVLISHLHGDHFYGLIGFLSTLSLLNRKNELSVFAPKGIKEIIHTQLKHANSYLSYPLHIFELESTRSHEIINHDKFTVKTIPLDHRVYTNGFLITEKPRDRKINIEEVKRLNIDRAYYRNIIKGSDHILKDGTRISNHQLTFAPDPVKSYAYCSDTTYKPDIVPLLSQSTVLYHESTFLENNLDLCIKTKHSTAKQAATIASLANVGSLILGHYSARYSDIDSFREEALAVFSNVFLAKSGKVFSF